MSVEISEHLDLVVPMLKADEERESFQNCEDEPIRIPGSIQRHGFLLVLDAAEQYIIAASENSPEFLDVPFHLILDTPLDTVLPVEMLGALRGLSPELEAQEFLTYLGSFQLGDGFYSFVTHRVAGQRVLEFERVDRLVSPELTNQVITNFVNKLSKITTEKELCEAITSQVKSLTGFNRVLLYHFDEFGHGNVICEENDGVLPTYLGLRFPATDIPKQARDLYVLNTVRIIPDADYVPSPLLGRPSRSFKAFDLSLAVLRSVSPIHVQYMKNMGTTASMSISIVCEGKLWGLISCHHKETRTLPYMVRSACDLLTKLVGTQLISFRVNSRLQKMVYFHEIQRRMLTCLAADNDYFGAMAEQMDSLMLITDSEGAALLVDGELKTVGQTPGREAILQLASWMEEKMDQHPELEIFRSRHLGRDIPWAAGLSERASGLLAIRISNVKQSYVMWFRPEVLRTVVWAGEPKKKEDDLSLRPRGSFEIWKEVVQGRSKPWTEMEIDSALEFRAAVTTISLKRSEEAVQLGEARFSQLTHALPNLVWTADNEGVLTYVNQPWIEQGLGTGGVWFQEQRLGAGDEVKCRELWTAAISNGEPFECELRFRSILAGGERWHMVRAVPYLRTDGTRAGWVAAGTDLTDKHQRDTALRMTEKLALTGRMTSVIAHEINNPLEAIGNLLYLLAANLNVDSESRAYVQLIESELLRISGITKQTLRWSGESIKKAEYGSASDIFDDVLRLYAGKIRNRQVTVVVERGGDVPLYGQLGQITQVLSNLVANAISAVPVGGKFWLKAFDEGSQTVFVVRDQGHGMSRETLQKIFAPFFTTKGDLGNGLGLYISKEIVERHGGTLTVQSEVGVGTEIQVRLPAKAH